MRSFRDITEAKEAVVFGFGRFNPSTIGHEKLMMTSFQYLHFI